MGYFYAIAASLLFGMNGSVAKVIMQAGLSPTQLTMFRTIGIFVISGIVLTIIERGALRISARQLGIMAILGVVGVAILQASYAFAVQLMPVGIALLIEYLAVLFVPMVAFVFFKEKVRARLWVAIGLVLVGLAVVAQIWSGTLNGLGLAMALVAAVALTVYFVVGEHQLGSTSPLAVLFWSSGFAMVFWGIFSGWWEVNPAILVTPVSLSGNLASVVLPLWVPLAWSVSMGSFMPFLLSFSAIRRLSATTAGVIATSEGLFAFTVAWLWLGEAFTPLQIVGAAVVTAGIVLAQTSRAGKIVDPELSMTLLIPDKERRREADEATTP
jgi:drug/metabolite transporter (DMT)-like permease